MVTKRYYAVIVAGGSGTRMGGDLPKQFLELGGKPLLAHTIERFLAMKYKVEIIIVLPSAHIEYWKEYCSQNRFIFSHAVVAGGLTRYHSVKNALKYVAPGGVVAVHDGVRPLVTTSFLEGIYESASQSDAVVPVIKPVDSMRVETEEGNKIVDRSKYFMVQTPQVFSSELLLDAYKQPYMPEFTDDASVVEAMGHKIKFVDGLSTNIKITTPGDLILAEAILSVS